MLSNINVMIESMRRILVNSIKTNIAQSQLQKLTKKKKNEHQDNYLLFKKETQSDFNIIISYWWRFP